MGLQERAVLPLVPDCPAHPPTLPLSVEAKAPHLLGEGAGLTHGTQRRDAGCWARRDGSSASFWKIFPTVLFCYRCHSKINRVRGLNNRNRGWKSEIKMLPSCFPPRPLSLACRRPSSPSCLHTLFPLCVCTLISSSYKDTRPVGFGSTPVNSFSLNYLF